jgi:diamine N-acetyltransferase
MQKYLDEVFTLDKCIGELKDPDVEFYFAMLYNSAFGYIKNIFGEAKTELQNLKSLEIERINILKTFQGNLVGLILFDKFLKIAIWRQADYLKLDVCEKNLEAMHFYKRNGFIIFDKYIFTFGYDTQIDLMMKLQLNCKIFSRN